MWSAIYLCLLVITGYAVSAGLARKSSRLEVAALTLCMGPGIMGFCLILLSMLGMRPSMPEVLAIAGLFTGAGIFIRQFSRNPQPTKLPTGPRPPWWWIIFCLIGIAYGLMAILKDALFYRVIEWDAFAIWQLKSKVLAIYPLTPRPSYFTDLAMSYSHLRYPLLVPMISAGMHAMTGRLDDFGKAVSLLLYPGMGMAVFAAVRRINGVTAALTSVTMLACLEPFCRYGGSGTAEMAITAFYACSLLCILRWREDRSAGFLVLGAIFNAWMAWTKNEGLALAAVSAIVIAASGPREKRRQSLAAGAAFAGIVVILYLPWILYSWGIPRTDEDYAGRFASLQIFTNLGRLPAILIGFAKELIDWEDWGLLWIIAFALSLAERRRFKNPLIATIGILLVLHIVAYIPAFLVTNWKLEELLGVTTDRLLMHAAPAGAILVGALWPAWAGGMASKDGSVPISENCPPPLASEPS